ncbi:MAG: hypothetical protein JWM57_3067 [Phycisphaerales bacterium]|nr:hypothetical protein [Phycisphaerales bacterium]
MFFTRISRSGPSASARDRSAIRRYMARLTDGRVANPVLVAFEIYPDTTVGRPTITELEARRPTGLASIITRDVSFRRPAGATQR